MIELKSVRDIKDFEVSVDKELAGEVRLETRVVTAVFCKASGELDWQQAESLEDAVYKLKMKAIEKHFSN